MSDPGAALLLRNARLPRWLLPADWPIHGGAPGLADIALAGGRVQSVLPARPGAAGAGGAAETWDLAGALALPGLIDAHLHLDKTFTLPRLGAVEPGLLGAIDAMMRDKAGWTPGDVRQRAERGLLWAWQAGSVHLRTHCDWWDPAQQPIAWPVLRELAEDWQGRVWLERVNLSPLTLYADRDWAWRTARDVAASGPGARLGGFVHSTNWDPQALTHLLQAAQAFDLDVDLHCDEELNAGAQGLAGVVATMTGLGFEGRVVCGHVCALAAKPEAEAFALLDAVARLPITLVALPVTNLLLQDATAGRTPRQRGLTLVKEARERGIPVLLASDNVQDPFCPVGGYDPLEALLLGAAVAQLGQPFDAWSDAVCRADWLGRAPGALPLTPGAPADLVLLPEADAWGFPSRSQPRLVLRAGVPVRGTPPAAWLRAPSPEELAA